MSENMSFERKMAVVVAALSKAGFDPMSQLVGYYQTGDPTFITRQDNARAIIQTIDRERLGRFITEMRQKIT